MLHSHKCIRCERYWSSQANPALFHEITRFCPDCIGRYMPILVDRSVRVRARVG